MPEETDKPNPTDLPDYVKKYFTDRQKDLKLLDRLPETRKVLASLSPEEVKVLDRIGISLETDSGEAEVTEEYVDVETVDGDELVEYAADTMSSGSSLWSYPFVVH